MFFFTKNHLPTQNLFSNTEVGEDFAQDVVGGDFTGDLAQVVHALAYVLAHEVAAQAVAQALDAALDGGAGAGEGLVVACIGHDQGIVVDLGQAGSCDDVLLQPVDSIAVFCRNEDRKSVV